jgi:hypothetical protein
MENINKRRRLIEETLEAIPLDTLSGIAQHVLITSEDTDTDVITVKPAYKLLSSKTLAKFKTYANTNKIEYEVVANAIYLTDMLDGRVNNIVAVASYDITRIKKMQQEEVNLFDDFFPHAEELSEEQDAYKVVLLALYYIFKYEDKRVSEILLGVTYE